MATKGQIEKAMELRVIPTGQPLEKNPAVRVREAGINLGRSSAPRLRVQGKTHEGGGRYSYDSGREAAELELYNIDGEIMLKALYNGIYYFGRHDKYVSEEGYRGSLGRRDDNDVLGSKADALAKELQVALIEAGKAGEPGKNAVTLRELREEASDLRYLDQDLRDALSRINGREWRHFDVVAVLQQVEMAKEIVVDLRASGDETAATLVEKLGGEG